MAHAALAEDSLVDDSYPGRGREIDAPALALDNEIHRQARAHQPRFLERFKAFDRIPVDHLYPLASLDSRYRRWTARLHPPDARRMLNPAKGQEHAGENHE